MPLWSIGASQKKEEIPGSSKWIRNELFTLHDLIANDVEQFAYSVASELTWIDEQMEEILNDTEKNPKLLLESPTKLRGSESPVKKLRDHALALKSPLKEVNTNTLRISPIRFQKELDDSPSRKMPQSINRSAQKNKSPLKAVPLAPPKHSPFIQAKESKSPTKTQSPFLDSVRKSAGTTPSVLSSFRSKLSMENEKEVPPSPVQKMEEGKQNMEEENIDSLSIRDSADKTPREPSSTRDENKSQERAEPSSLSVASTSPKVLMDKKSVDDDDDDDKDGEYDASMEDISFQAIRKSIRRTILKKTQEKSEETSVTTDSSFKDADDEGPQQSSMVVNQGSIDTLNDSKSSNTTIKVSLKDDNTKSNKIGSNTPGHRQSQGFALLPHRDPLTVKSAKKKSLENAEEFTSKPNGNLGSSPSSKLSPLVFKPSLYPTINFQDSESQDQKEDLPAKSKSPEPHQQDSPSKKAANKREMKGKLVETKQLSYSPPQEQIINVIKQPTNSPLSNLFATVGSTLRKARSKFSKDLVDGKSEINPTHKIQKPKKNSTGSHTTNLKSPVKRIISNDETDVISRLAAPTEASQAKSAKRIASGASNALTESPIKNKDERSSMKFSPVKSIYGSLRSEMNKSVHNSPSKLSQPQVKSPKKNVSSEYPSKPEDNPLKEQNDENRKSHGFKPSNQPKNLARMSLSKPQRIENHSKETNTQQQRKSFAKGLASMPLEPSSKANNRFRQKSLAGDHQPLKRKTQTEEEVMISTANQPYRKIGTKIIPPSIVQSKQQQDAKRRRTADQIQSVLQKRASRVSNTHHDSTALEQQVEESANEHVADHQQVATQQNYIPAQAPAPPQQASRIISSNYTKPHSKYGQVPNTQTLMKTAVLQHARMNTEFTKTNTFQSGSISKVSSSSMLTSPVTPKAPTVLPEIFSESDDDEEGSVLKDWANSPELRNILIHQQNIDPDHVFGPIAPLHMEEIFKNSRLSRFKGRGSSAQWSGQDGLTIQEVQNYKQKAYKK